MTTWAPRGWGVFVFDPQSAWQADSWLVQQDWDDRSAPSPPDAHPAWAHRIASLQQTEAPNWTSVAHQAPSATGYALAQHLMQHESYDGTAWMICMQRLASRGWASAQVMDLVVQLPSPLAQTLQQLWRTQRNKPAQDMTG